MGTEVEERRRGRRRGEEGGAGGGAQRGRMSKAAGIEDKDGGFLKNISIYK